MAFRNPAPGMAAKEQYNDILNRFNTVNLEPEWPEPLSEDAFHGIAGDVVRAIEPHTEADTAALLVQFLAAFGSMVGRGPHYQVEGDQHHANLFAVLVGRSAKARKGTSWGRIRELFGLIDDPWTRSCVHSGLSSGEGLIWAVRDATGDDDEGIRDKRALVQESEFANVLKVMSREGNTLSRVIRDAWDRGDLATMTKNSPAVATGAHISIVGHVTAEELKRYLNATESANGFANRFMFICVKRARLLPHGGDLDSRTLIPLARRLDAAVRVAQSLGRITMDEAAATTWTAIYEKLSEGKPGLIGSITARVEAQVIRLATVYAMLDGSSVMKVPHLEAALAVWEYAEASACYIFGSTTGDPMADELLHALKAAPDGLTRTAISELFKRHKSKARINSALDTLAKAGKVKMEAIQTDGRSIELWRAL